MKNLNFCGRPFPLFLLICTFCGVHSVSVSSHDPMNSELHTGWTAEGANPYRVEAIAELNKKLQEKYKIGEAKNIIMFLGDGWDIQTLTAARIMKGQKVDHLEFGEEAKLYLESFPYTGLSKTYCADSQVADSACSTTAYLCGIKNNIGTIGVTANVLLSNCSAGQHPANQGSSILAWAQAKGKSTGIVTTTFITDASPTGAYAHTANRNWECDADVAKAGLNPDICDDIAEQLTLHEPGKNIDVIFGGGRVKFLPTTVADSEGFFGQRQDGKNLIESWKTLKSQKKAVYVETATDMELINPFTTDAVLGLFAPGHLAYFDEQKANGDPRLKDMTRKAIEILSKNPKGFFLFVEGGRIDHAHH